MAETEAALQSKNTPIQRVDEWLARRAERPQSEAIRDGVEMAIDALSKALRESVRGRELGAGEWGGGVLPTGRDSRMVAHIPIKGIRP